MSARWVAHRSPRTRTNHGSMKILEASLGRTPDRVAVRCGAEARTCADVSNRSTALAAALRERGVQPGDVVAVCLDRSVDMPVALLGVLKSGAAYVPLDPIYPADRLAYMLEDSGARIVVADRQLADRLPPSAVPTLWLEPETWATVATPATTGSARDLAYTSLTSGSTGRPKGVEIPRLLGRESSPGDRSSTSPRVTEAIAYSR